jgi:hypothetical protein
MADVGDFILPALTISKVNHERQQAFVAVYV